MSEPSLSELESDPDGTATGEYAADAAEERIKQPEVLTATTLGGLKIDTVQEAFEWINMLVYGFPGVGKTVLAGSASEVEEMSPVLIIDIEGGTMSLRERYPDVQRVRIKSWKEMVLLYNALFDKEIAYRTIVLDSLTEIQKFSMAQIMKDVIKKDSSRDPDIPSVREWGKNIEQIRALVRGFRDLPCHTIMTGLPKQQQVGTGPARLSPSLPGQLGNDVPGFMDIVAYMYTKLQQGNIKRFLLTAQTDTQVAKDRSDSLETVVTEPTMSGLYRAIIGGQSEA